MKLEIKANDFCPDDCPYVSPQVIGEHSDGTAIWGCWNDKACLNAYKQKRNKNAVYAVKEKNIGNDLIAIFDNEEAAKGYIAEQQKYVKYPVGLTIEAWEVKE